MTALVEVAGLTFDYGAQRALHGIGCRLERGSVTALVGPNGAGKTTLMRCIAGLETPLAGSITLAGIDVLAEPRDSHRQLGFLADAFGVASGLSVRQALHYAARAQGAGVADAQAAVDSVAARLGLSELLARPATELSRGQRQRVAIGQAMIHRPALLILDEPASGLDPQARAALARLLGTLRDEGMTLLVSSHILAELDQYSTHMLMLHDGRVVEHRALAAAGQTQRRLRLGVAGPGLGAARRWLAEHVAVNADEIGGALEFVYAGDDAVQAALLARLVAAGVSVCAFGEVRENMQQSYLRSAERAAAGWS